MKQAKTRATSRNRSRLPGFETYSPYPQPYMDILDTDEDRVMKHFSRTAEDAIDILDTDEDIIIQYYRVSERYPRENYECLNYEL